MTEDRNKNSLQKNKKKIKGADTKKGRRTGFGSRLEIERV